MRVYTQFEPPPKPVVRCTEDLARQSEKDSTDVNRIVAQFKVTGMLPQRNDALYLDVSNVPDYRAALSQIQYAEGVFMKLPAEVRAKFANDPALFLDALVDPARKDELVEMGLVPKEKEAVPPVVDGVVTP